MVFNTETKSAIALGIFDGLHLGHDEVIQTALNTEGMTPAVFTLNGVFKKNKSDSPENIMSTEMKFALLKKMGVKSICAPEFESISSLSAEEFIDEFLVDRMNAGLVSCGWNFRFSKNAAAGTDDLERICNQRGIKVKVIPPIIIDNLPVNSTAIRSLIREGNIIAANRMLGRNHMYELPVIEGAKLGRKLNAPTINQIIPAECVLPKFGVYKSKVVVDLINYIAITNIGIKPTIAGGISKPIMETHIPGFNADVYGQIMKVELLDFIRPEQKFNSIDDLKIQIQQDIRKACK